MTSRPQAAARVGPYYALACASGAAGLGYEMLWTRMLAVSLGHEVIAVLAVVAAFFVGLALGALGLGPVIRRSRRPARIYAGLELTIGLWALVLIPLIPTVNAILPRWIGPSPSALHHWGVAFGSTLLLLLPATAAMGATLPALVRTVSGAAALAGHAMARDRIAGLYAANTFGAVLGTLAATFLLAPALGYPATLTVLAALNAVSAAAALRLGRGRSAVAPEPVAAVSSESGVLRSLVPLFAVGCLGIGYEVAMVRALSQVLADTVYTFAVLLAVYLTGIALGAAWLQQRPADRAPRGLWLFAATSLACAFGAAGAGMSPRIFRAMVRVTGGGFAVGVALELALGALVFVLPTAAMGALFSHLARRTAPRAGLDRVLAANMLGSALAPLLIGVLLIPALGSLATLAVLSLGYLCLPTGERGAAAVEGLAARLRYLVGPALVSAGLLLVVGPEGLVTVPAGGRLLAHHEGVMAAVSVVSVADGERFLKVNDRFTMGGTASQLSDHRQTHLPLLWHGRAERALYLGIGTGLTFDAARDYPGLSATGVELVPEVLSVLGHFDADPRRRQWSGEPRLIVADARRFVLADPSRYDVIIADLFHPWVDGAGTLYTREHFEAVRAGLAEGGLFCQWLPLYQLDEATLRVIIRTFVDVFPHAQAHLAHFSLEQPIIALVGRRRPAPGFVSGWLESRVHHRPLQRRLLGLRLNSDFALYGGFLADRAELARFAGEGPLNTDMHPVVQFGSPAFAYGPPAAPTELLLRLVDQTAAGRARATRHAQGGTGFEARLERYWLARDAFLRAGRHVRPTADIRGMLAQVREPLLEVVRISPDFAPAYAPLLGMAKGLYPQDPTAARALLTELAQVQPERPEALALRRRMFGQ